MSLGQDLPNWREDSRCFPYPSSPVSWEIVVEACIAVAGCEAPCVRYRATQHERHEGTDPNTCHYSVGIYEAVQVPRECHTRAIGI